jgi:hypothetical protein|tara:strand:- start:294 stop:626 length:333 start_codon:yes stop_codon:yes gene_type:complete
MNKSKSKTLGKLLKKEGIEIQYMLDWDNRVDDKAVNYTDQPHLGSAMSDGKEGWYFRKHGGGDWSSNDKKVIKRVIESKGYKVGHIDDSETEWDNDRTYPSSVTFFKVYG